MGETREGIKQLQVVGERSLRGGGFPLVRFFAPDLYEQETEVTVLIEQQMRDRGVIAGLGFDESAVFYPVREHAEDGVGLGESALAHSDIVPVTGKFPFLGMRHVPCRDGI